MGSRAGCRPTRDHPFTLDRELCFWSFIVAPQRKETEMKQLNQGYVTSYVPPTELRMFMKQPQCVC
jgi:hypothetical protein